MPGGVSNRHAAWRGPPAAASVIAVVASILGLLAV